ncbi:MAG: biotin/lipoate A/B protein ligase family protein [Candidatus Lokiarchaeia archaeon]
MPEKWRLLWAPGLDGPDIVAYTMTAIEGKILGISPNTFLLSGFSKYSISIGRYQDLDLAIDYSKAEQKDIDVVRRPIGGGVILIDPVGSRGLGLTVDRDFFPSLDAAFRKVGAAITESYKRLGVKDAWYKYVGDVMVGDRKITGFGFTEIEKIMVLQCIISLKDLDFGYFSDVVQLYPEKFRDKRIKDLSEILTSVETEIGSIPSNEEFKTAFEESFREVLGIEFEEGGILDAEREIYKKWRDYATSPENKFAFSSMARFPKLKKLLKKGYKFVFAKNKKDREVVVHILINADGKIEDIMFSGDFYCRPEIYLKDLENSLKGIDPTDETEVYSKVMTIFERSDWEIPMVQPEDIVKPIIEAAKRI